MRKENFTVWNLQILYNNGSVNFTTAMEIMQNEIKRKKTEKRIKPQ